MLTSGTRLGSYEVLAQIGAGGMGEVYQAHDSKLGREVAIKVLPSAFANDPDRLSRFQREAKMLAALNHPNIATIHGLEQSGSTQFLVMELVPGETLADRVRSGPVPVEEALKIAAQIAEALEAAHEKNIIHRDLKPANVKVTPEGKVKVLDFGLAKAFEGESGASDLANSPTLTQAATMQGVILGTAAYMSPEQARAKAVDKRTDLWAFGCVLYEMLTGKPAFHGEDTTEILAAVVKTEPDWNRLPPSTPSMIRDLLRRCLQKDKTLRLRDAGDARIEIGEALSRPATANPDTRTLEKGTRSLGQRTLISSAGALLLGAAVAGFGVWHLKGAPAQPVQRFAIALPSGQQLSGLESGQVVALSADGMYLAYVASQGGTQRIYLRQMNSLEAKPLYGTEGANDPFFSPDSQWLGFFANGKLMKVSVNGGAILTLCDAASPAGASWSSLGMVAFAPGAGVIQQVAEAGGTPQPLTHFNPGEVGHRWPQFLPDGKAVLFSVGGGGGAGGYARIVIQAIGTGSRRALIQGGISPRYAPSGHLVYVQDGTLMAVPFDSRRLEVTGSAIPIVEAVAQSAINATAQYSFSSTGSLTYIPGTVEAAQRQLVWVSRNGAEQPLAVPPHAYRQPRLSPDGRRVAITIDEQGNQVWIYDLSRETLTRMTFGGNANTDPAWTPDGKRIAFESDREGPQNLFWQLADGSGGLERLNTSDTADYPLSWSPDGQFLAFVELNPNTGRDIWVLRTSDRKAQLFLRTPFMESSPQFSPDGRWLAYISDESGRFEVYVQPYPGPGGKWQISTDGGTEPVWNGNGKELFYRNGSKIMAVDITTQPNFAGGKPHMLFEGQYSPSQVTFPNYDVSPDGKKFLMLKAVEKAQAAPTQINVVLNWFEELKRRVPTGR